jgi:hypothetical protein
MELIHDEFNIAPVQNGTSLQFPSGLLTEKQTRHHTNQPVLAMAVPPTGRYSNDESNSTEEYSIYQHHQH